MRNSSSTRTAGIVLVADDTRVIRASTVARRMKRAHGLRELASELGVSHSALWRFLKANGYEHATGWVTDDR